MKLTPALREVLKKPLGQIMADPAQISKDAVLVCVGDTASDRLISAGYRPKLAVYDGMTRRKPVGVSKAISSYDAPEHRIKNPAGHVEEAVFRLFRTLLEGRSPSRVFVEGEEDLTALAAIAEAENGTVVAYGQPDEGLVVVRVDDEVKDKVKKILEEMEDGS
ncbi:MAG: GTP-dependent dephospho-CoA kinase family protein [Candidatus Altiarchaeota archaeon]